MGGEGQPRGILDVFLVWVKCQKYPTLNKTNMAVIGMSIERSDVRETLIKDIQKI